MTTAPKNFLLSIEDKVAFVRLNRPERKNPLTFESYAELRDWFRALPYTEDIRRRHCPKWRQLQLWRGCSWLIGPLTKMDIKELLSFTRMTGDRSGDD